MPLRKVHELAFLWFGLPGATPDVRKIMQKNTNASPQKRAKGCKRAHKSSQTTRFGNCTQRCPRWAQKCLQTSRLFCVNTHTHTTGTPMRPPTTVLTANLTLQIRKCTRKCARSVSHVLFSHVLFLAIDVTILATIYRSAEALAR